MTNDLDAATDAIEDETAVDLSIYRASNGLVFKLRRVPQMAMLMAHRRLTVPQIPKTWDENRERDIDNPADPTYQAAIQNYKFDQAMLAVNTYFILGTRIDESVGLPEDVDPINSESWVALLQFVDPGLEIPESGPRRYLAWITMHALPDEDQTKLLEQCVRYSGAVLEVDVAAAQRSFRRAQERNTARGVFTVEGEHRALDSAIASLANGAGLGTPGSGDIQPVQLDGVDDPPLL